MVRNLGIEAALGGNSGSGELSGNWGCRHAVFEEVGQPVCGSVFFFAANPVKMPSEPLRRVRALYQHLTAAGAAEEEGPLEGVKVVDMVSLGAGVNLALTNFIDADVCHGGPLDRRKISRHGRISY